MSAPSSLNGVLVIDKPTGPTSHDVVVQVRRRLGAKVGHTGTLDPLASGVLPLVLGNATRLARFFQASDKVYEGVVELGAATETYDREGRVTETHEVGTVPRAEIERVLACFTGVLQQRPPRFSAIKVGGERLYKAARRGEVKQVPARTVEVFEIRPLEIQPRQWRLQIHCSAGTYIRSLAHDIGQELGVGAHLKSLRRLRSGDFTEGGSVTLEELPERWEAALIPMERLLRDWPRIDLSEDSARRLSHGLSIPLSEELEGAGLFEKPAELEERELFWRLFFEDRLLGLGEAREGALVPRMIFNIGKF